MWARRRDDAITDVEVTLLLKRIHPGFSLGNDALLLLTALLRELLRLLRDALAAAGARADSVEGVAACVAALAWSWLRAI
jgi:hypothetical protein